MIGIINKKNNLLFEITDTMQGQFYNHLFNFKNKYLDTVITS